MPYPLILNGDHAEFEIEHANTPPKERPDWPLPSFDARDWAESFNKTAVKLGYSDMDEGWLVGWFANALMRGFDERSARYQAEKVMKPAVVPRAQPTDADKLQADLEELLGALGMSTAAKPQSPHEVFQEALAVLRERLAPYPHA